ncbi:MAG: DUF2461 domain-containing protein [Paludibacteraceae bacterium]
MGHWLADAHSGSFAPHSPCRRATVNAPANRQMPIASVVRHNVCKAKNLIVMKVNTNLVLDFLKKLEENNSLTWMKANKTEYETAKSEFEKLIQELINRISVYDSSIIGLQPSKLIFRLNRDTRFSKDKSPYNPSFRAHISQAERFPIPAGYYLNIKPNHIFLGRRIIRFSISGSNKDGSR